MNRLLTRLLTGLIRAYQLVVSPWFAPRCRFSPSCSAYALKAVQVHGPMRGSWLATRRVLRCNPWNAGGLDPVPPPHSHEDHPHSHPGEASVPTHPTSTGV